MSDERQPTGNAPEFRHVVRLGRLGRDAPHAFALVPDAETRAGLAAFLGLLGLRKLRFAGTLRPVERDGWQLEGTLGATVVQPCVATLAPVQTRLDVPVRRMYLRDADEILLSEELEITSDTSDEMEPLGNGQIDLAELAMGELALALPPYPRAKDAPEPDVAEAPSDTHRPFEALAALKAKISNGGGET